MLNPGLVRRPQQVPGAEELAQGVRAGNRRALAQAITLIESTRADHRELARRLVGGLMPHTGASYRVGITGVPGVGKSTFIEAFGASPAPRPVLYARPRC